MVREVEDAIDRLQARAAAQPSKEPPSGWLNRTVDKIEANLKEPERRVLSERARARAKVELRERILHGGDACEQRDKSWSDSFVSVVDGGEFWVVSNAVDCAHTQVKELLDTARQARDEIERREFFPRKGDLDSQRGTRRLFAALPQYGFATRYMPISTAVLRAIVGLAWGNNKTNRPKGLQGLTTDSEDWEWWSHVIRPDRLQGVQVPGTPDEAVANRRSTKRQFAFFMSTDGVGCSLLCCRPKRASASAPLTADKIQFGPNTVIRGLDPGVNNVAAVVTAIPDSGTDEDGQMGSSGGR
jgi:hypothetical protein